MQTTRLDSRGWNTSNAFGNLERAAPKPQKPQPAGAEDLKLSLIYYGVCIGFLLAGVLALIIGSPIGGIG